MKPRILVGVVVAAAAGWLGFHACGAEIYRVDASVPSGGIDLVGGGYAGDALNGPTTDALVSVTGAVTYASNLSAAHPFTIDNGTANAKLTFKDSGLLGNVPLRVIGASNATTYFDGDTLTVDETTQPSILTWEKTILQIDNLTVSSKTGPAVWNITNSTFYVRRNTRIGYDGGTGTVVVAATALGRTNGTDVPGIGGRGQANLYLGDVSSSGKGVSSGTLHIKGGSASAWNVHFGSDNVPTAEEGVEDAPNRIQLDGGYLIALSQYLHGPRDAKFVFNGGQIKSHGWSTFLTFAANSSGDWIFEGQNGKAIDVLFGKFAQFVTWKTGATGQLIFRGASDVYLYGGDFNSSSSYDEQCSNQGAQYKKRSDGQGFVWEQTGNLHFKTHHSGARSLCQIMSDDLFPHGAANGAVVIETSQNIFTVNLRGTTQSCNSLIGGGVITNTSETAATINIGENGNNCQFDVKIGENSPMVINKLGAGEILVSKPIPGTFSVQGGTVVVSDATGAVTFGSLTMAEGTSLDVRGGIATLPPDFDLSSTGTGVFCVTEAGVLRVGGDADTSFDISRLSSDTSAVLEKVGSGCLTLVGTSSFNGKLLVREGRVAVSADASLRTLAAIEVADGAALDLATDVRLVTYALTAGDAVGAVDHVYSGTAGENIEALTGLTGEGQVSVARATALWTGAVDDSATNPGNWQGISDAPDVTGGTFTPVFAAASDNDGKMDVTKGMAFRGLKFTTDITSFTLAAAQTDASLALGMDGISLAGEATDSTTRAVTLETPLAVTTGWQTWTLPGSNQTLTVTKPFADAASANMTVATEGNGKVYFHSTNSTYTGSIVISNEMAYAYGHEPFGPSNVAGTAVLRVNNKKSGTRLQLANTVISKPVVLDLTGGEGGRKSFGFAANTTNIFYGAVLPRADNNVDAFNLPESSTVIFAGGYGSPNKRFYMNWASYGMVVISNKPMHVTSCEATTRRLRLHCPGNTYTGMGAWSNNQSSDYNPYNPMLLSVDFHCDWAFDVPNAASFFAGTWDLHGHDQRIGPLHAPSSAVIRSFDGPATFYVNQYKWKSNYPYLNSNKNYKDVAYPFPPSRCKIEGEVSIYKTGELELAFSNRVIAATGTVTVAEGPFTLHPDATWLGATNIVVTGGTFNLTASGQLGRGTDFHLVSGALNLADGVTQKARYLYLDGSERHAPTGVYGSLENIAIPAARRTARITGTGTLNVLGDGSGFVLLFR